MKKFMMALVCLMTLVASTSCTTDDWDDDYLAYSDGYSSSYSYSNQCAATTKKGTRCKRNAEKGSIYCWQHKK